jgi:hypothetical protein
MFVYMKSYVRLRSSVVFSLVLLAVPCVFAQEQNSFERKHQVGARLGVWANGGDSPPGFYEAPGLQFRSDINDANVYFEGFGAYRLFSQAMVELSFGFVNRGDISLIEGEREYYGSLVLYPILLQFKYGLPSPGGKLYPYVAVGGGFYYGRNSVQFTNDVFFSLNQTSETDFNYVLSGGIDWPLAGSVGAEINVKYMPINFSKDLFLVRDYQAFAVSFGIKYLFTSGEQDE